MKWMKWMKCWECDRGKLKHKGKLYRANNVHRLFPRFLSFASCCLGSSFVVKFLASVFACTKGGPQAPCLRCFPRRVLGMWGLLPPPSMPPCQKSKEKRPTCLCYYRSYYRVCRSTKGPPRRGGQNLYTKRGVFGRRGRGPVGEGDGHLCFLPTHKSPRPDIPHARSSPARAPRAATKM